MYTCTNNILINSIFIAYTYTSYTYWTQSGFLILLTTLSAFSNLNLLKYGLKVSMLFFIILIIADLFMVPDSKCFSSQVSLISQ